MEPNRYFCTVLDECRVALSKLCIFNLWYFKRQLAMLLEELQNIGNRMEAGLHDKHDKHRYHAEAKKIHAELKTLRMEKEEIDADITEMQLLVKMDYQVKILHQKKMKLTREVSNLHKEKSELLDIDEGLMDLEELW